MIKIVIPLLLLLVFSNVNAKQTINMAFGFELGAMFESESWEHEKGRMGSFKPANPYPPLVFYDVLLTRTSHLIYQISAESFGMKNDECIRQKEALVSLLQKKYGQATYMGRSKNAEIKQNDTSVSVYCLSGLSDGVSILRVVYLDRSTKSKTYQEYRVEQKLKHKELLQDKDTSGL